MPEPEQMAESATLDAAMPDHTATLDGKATLDGAAGLTEPADSVADEALLADDALLAAHDLALAGLVEITPESTIGSVVGHIVEGEHVLSLLFECTLPGYPGWHWTVTVARVDEDSDPVVVEAELLPGENALLAPDWVPWAERLADYQAAQVAARAAGEATDEEADDADELDADGFDDEDEDDDEFDDVLDEDVLDDVRDDGIDIESMDVEAEEISGGESAALEPASIDAGAAQTPDEEE